MTNKENPYLYPNCRL